MSKPFCVKGVAPCRSCMATSNLMHHLQMTDGDDITFPSQEAPHRLLIGTTMLNGSRASPVRTGPLQQNQPNRHYVNQSKIDEVVASYHDVINVSGNVKVRVATLIHVQIIDNFVTDEWRKQFLLRVPRSH